LQQQSLTQDGCFIECGRIIDPSPPKVPSMLDPDQEYKKAALENWVEHARAVKSDYLAKMET